MKIAYFPLGGLDVASSRLRVHKIVPELQSWGHEVEVLPISATKLVGDFDLVVVQKRLDLRGEMTRWQVPSVFDFDDPTPRLPKCTLVTAGSEELHRRHPSSVYIPDALDVDNVDVYKSKHPDDIKRVCWFGLACNAYHAEAVKDACNELGLQLVIITDVDGKHTYTRWQGVEYIKWELETVDCNIMACDLVVCPYLHGGRWPASWVEAKGENRVLKAWALGMPVAGTPVPSYVEHELQHWATTVDEWKVVLERLRSRRLRIIDARYGRQIALQRTADRVASLWEQAFERCVTT